MAASRLPSLLVPLVLGWPGGAAGVDMPSGDVQEGLEGGSAAKPDAATTARLPSRAGLPAEEAALLLSGEQGGVLRLESFAVVWDAGRDEARLRVSMEMSLEDLLELEADELGLRWSVYVLDADAVLVASTVRTLSAEPRRLEAGGWVGLRMLESIQVPPGPVSVRTLVRRVGTDEFGLRTLELDAGAGRGAFAPRQVDGWAEMEAQGSAPRPAALATAAPGSALDLLVPEDPGWEGAGWVLSPQAGNGREASPTPVEVVRSAAAREGWRAVTLSVPEAASGRYRLRRADDPRATGIAILVLPADWEGPGAWPEALRAPAALASAAPAPPGSGRLRSGPARQAWLEVLSSLGEEGLDPGVEALRLAMAEAWETAGVAGVERMVEVGLELGAGMAQHDPTALLPLLAMLDRLHGRCLEQRTAQCERASALLGSGLVTHAATAAPEAASLYADVWTMLGWRQLESRLFERAAEAFAVAAALERQHVASRLTLAILHEVMNRHRDAVDVLEELDEIQPGRPDVGLRLGIQYRRLGRKEAAIDRLTAASGEGPHWVRALAYSELAVMFREGGDEGAAEAVLRAALAELPGEEQLALQLAALLDSSGRFDEASAVLEALGEPTGAGPAPRHRYWQWPVAALESVRARFEAVVEADRTAFHAAIEAMAR